MNLKRRQIYYDPWPFMVVDNFLGKNDILRIKNEILNYKNYDDKVMTNRKRINKGSENFQYLTKKSKAVKKLYNQINNEKFYKKIRNFFKDEKLDWIPSEKFSSYSKDFFGEQKFSFKEKIIKGLSFLNLIKTSMNLDIDFSVSEKGYHRPAHRDRETRVMNFLIYLNSFNKKFGGNLEIHKSKFFKHNEKDYPRFPEKGETRLVKKIPPKAGIMIIFLSTPDSYHAAEKIYKDKLKRVFIYGSFSLNKKVAWTKNKFK